MAFSINQVVLVGNVTKPIELKYTASQMAMARFGLATNRSVKNQAGGYDDQVTFHNIVVWGKMAEFLSKSVTKGSKLVVTGRIDNRSYQDQQGVTKYVSEVVADSVIPMTDTRNQPAGQGTTAPTTQPTPPPQPAPLTPAAAAAPSGVDNMNMGQVTEIFNNDPPVPQNEPFPWETGQQ